MSGFWSILTNVEWIFLKIYEQSMNKWSIPILHTFIYFIKKNKQELYVPWWFFNEFISDYCASPKWPNLSRKARKKALYEITWISQLLGWFCCFKPIIGTVALCTQSQHTRTHSHTCMRMHVHARTSRNTRTTLSSSYDISCTHTNTHAHTHTHTHTHTPHARAHPHARARTRPCGTPVASVQNKLRYGNMTGVLHACPRAGTMKSKFLWFPLVAKVWQLHSPAIPNWRPCLCYVTWFLS